MQLDDIKRVWKRQETDPDMEYSQSELMMLINNKMTSLEKDIRSRDIIEWIACAVVIAVFGFYFFIFSSFWMKAGSVIIVSSAIFIAYKLKIAQPDTLNDEISANSSINEHLKEELEKIETQKDLLQNIAWWYIGPICIGLIVFTIGFQLAAIFKIFYIVIVLAMGAGIWYLNQKAVADRFDPLIREIRESLEFLEMK